MNNAKNWNGRQIYKEDKGYVTEIQCRHPTCKSHPHLRFINWVRGVPIGNCCIEKPYSRLDDFFEKNGGEDCDQGN